MTSSEPPSRKIAAPPWVVALVFATSVVKPPVNARCCTVSFGVVTFHALARCRMRVLPPPLSVTLPAAVDHRVLLERLLRGHGDGDRRAPAVERDDAALRQRRRERGLGAARGRAAADHGVRATRCRRAGSAPCRSGAAGGRTRRRRCPWSSRRRRPCSSRRRRRSWRPSLPRRRSRGCRRTPRRPRRGRSPGARTRSREGTGGGPRAWGP